MSVVRVFVVGPPVGQSRLWRIAIPAPVGVVLLPCAVPVGSLVVSEDKPRSPSLVRSFLSSVAEMRRLISTLASLGQKTVALVKIAKTVRGACCSFRDARRPRPCSFPEPFLSNGLIVLCRTPADMGNDAGLL